MLRRSTLTLGLLALLLAVGARPASAQTLPDTPQGKAEAQHEAKEAKHQPGHEAEALDEGESPAILQRESPLAIWTLVTFVTLMVVLTAFAWRPLAKALHEREAHLEQVLVDSEKARNEAEAIASENRRHLAEAADQVRKMLDDAQKQAKAVADQIQRDAQAQAEATRSRAERDIGTARDQALSEIYTKTADLAVAVAGKVLAKQMDESDHRRLVEVALAELPASPNGQGGVRA